MPTQVKLPNERRAKAAALRAEHPDWTLVQIGAELGVTSERTRQYLQSQGLPTAAVRQTKWFCRTCGKQVKWGRLLCAQCHYDASHSIVRCDHCGAAIIRRASENKSYPDSAHHKRTVHFCDKACQGAWLGAHYGRGRTRAHEVAKTS